jgi:antitoxin component YwqK of YwqJK toxin-antitoxin module
LIEGVFKDSKLIKNATFYYDNGNKSYEGDTIYIDDEKTNLVRHGIGTGYLDNGTIDYKGNWEYDEISGHGISYYENGNIHYEGSFEESKFSGYGVVFNEDGSVNYKGNWKDGLREGRGIQFYDDGYIEEGIFEEDELIEEFDDNKESPIKPKDGAGLR